MRTWILIAGLVAAAAALLLVLRRRAAAEEEEELALAEAQFVLAEAGNVEVPAEVAADEMDLVAEATAP